MKFLRSHWYDLGAGFAVVTIAVVAVARPHGVTLILWVSLVSLFIHQIEEYRFPGTFPGMINRVMFASAEPDRYPLNPEIAFIVNVSIGWIVYLLAAAFGAHAIWIAIAAILLSVGNFIAHTFLFNIRGKTLYNAGMGTAIVLFLPISGYFFYFVITRALATPADWIAGIVLGAGLNYLGVLKLIDLLKDKDTRYVFPQRNMGRAGA